MKAHGHPGLVYAIFGGDASAAEAARRLRSRIIESAGAAESAEARELPGILWGFVPTPEGSADRLDRAADGPREAVLRGDPVWMEPVSPAPCGAGELLRVWATEGRGTFRLLDNLWLAVVADSERGTLTIATDRIGGIRLHAARVGSLAVLCTSYTVLSRVVTDRAIDADAISIFLNLGYFPGTRTALRSVCLQTPATAIEISARGSRSEPYWKPDMHLHGAPDGDRDRKVGDVLDRVLHLFNATVREYAAGRESVCLALTSGLDSRAILSSLIRQKIPFSTYTHGFPGCVEERQVERIARRHGFPHRFVPLAESFTARLGKLALESFAATDGEISAIEKSHMIHVLSALGSDIEGRDVALILGGGAGMLKGSFYRLLRDDAEVTPAGIDGFVRWNLKKSFPDIFAPEIRPRDAGLLRDFVASELASVEGGSFHQKLDYLYLVRYRRWAGAVKEIYRRFYPVREPFVSAHMLDVLFGVDPAIKKRKLPHFEILRRNHEPLMLDPTNRLGPALPLNARTLHRFVPAAFWKARQLARGASRRYLGREVFRFVDYVDYATWIRTPEGLSLVDDLLEPRGLRSAFLYERGKLDPWIAEQRSGGYPSFPLIDKMCTLELYFREIEGS